MSKDIFVIAEGKTELVFIRDILAPYMGNQSIFLHAPQIGRHNRKGGNVKFSRAQDNIQRHLKQRPNTIVTTMVDYYRIGTDWPGLDESKSAKSHCQKAAIVNQATKKRINQLYPKYQPDNRFIPYVSMYEFEALLFSDPSKLASHLDIDQSKIDSILKEKNEPENINDSPISAPSKRLEKLKNSYKKVTDGKTIAKSIGIPMISKACPLFDGWLTALEHSIST